MLSAAFSKGEATGANRPLLGIWGPETAKGDVVASHLEGAGYSVSRYGSTAEALAAVRGKERPALLILTGEPRGSLPAPSRELRLLARDQGLPMLEVIEAGFPLASEPDWESEWEIDDWVAWEQMEAELPVRVGRLLRRRGGQVAEEQAAKDASMQATARFLPLIIHDLRTPLNVVGLSLRMIDHVIPRGNPELLEDLRFVEENFKHMERMLAQLSDYCRLFEAGANGEMMEFSPQRLLSDVVESRLQKPGATAVPVRVEVRPSCPPEVQLDPNRARQAIHYALANALTAAKADGVSVTLHGGPDRWVTEFQINHPPPPSVASVELHSDRFERLCGTPAERRGMDLAIAARISELFGGAARLEVDPAHGSTIVLDWPARSEAH